MKQLEPKRVVIGDVAFAIYPFGAIYAANLSGELGKFLGPLAAGALPLIGSGNDVMEMDLKDAVPLVAGAFNTLDGDRVEMLLKKLLTDRGNISCQYRDETTGKAVQEVLTEDLADAIFCQDIYGMYRLAAEVINVNFSGFFRKLLGQFGNLEKITGIMEPRNTGNSTEAGLQGLN